MNYFDMCKFFQQLFVVEKEDELIAHFCFNNKCYKAILEQTPYGFDEDDSRLLLFKGDALIWDKSHVLFCKDNLIRNLIEYFRREV